MSRTRATWVLLLGASLFVGGCSDSDAKDGATGATGDKGDKGDVGMDGADGKDGAAGPAGVDGADGKDGETGATGMAPAGTLGTSCLTPCHGFNGVVEQWKASRHFATYIANLGGDEVASWTGKTACGNCHAIDGVEQRIAGSVLYTGTTGPADTAHGQLNYKRSTDSAVAEGVYGGHASVAEVHCSTCHDTAPKNDPHVTGADYEIGSFPLRVPSAANDFALIERSSALGVSDGTQVKYGKGNACIWCHKSRKDVTNYVADPVKITSAYWGPHEGPHADVFTGKGGYEYAAKTYTSSSHQSMADGCVNCHMPAIEANQSVGDHSFRPQLSACKTCHADPATTLKTGVDRTTTKLQRLRAALAKAGVLSKDGIVAMDPNAMPTDTDFAHDVAMPQGKGVVTAVGTAGALYNYFIFARGGALGAHNPMYTSQLLYDSIQAAGGDLTGLDR